MQTISVREFLASNASSVGDRNLTCKNAEMTIPLTFYVATELRAAKERSGLTNSQIAGRIGVSESSVSRIMAGNQAIDLDRIAAIAKACKQPVRPILDAASARYDKQKKTPHSEE